VGLLGVELAPVARGNELDGVSNGRWPVETLSKSISHDGPRSCMVATSPRVYVLEEVSTLFYGDVALQDPRWASSV